MCVLFDGVVYVRAVVDGVADVALVQALMIPCIPMFMFSFAGHSRRSRNILAVRLLIQSKQKTTTY